jgi:four helix bundle protein
MSSSSYKDLIAWQRAMALVAAIYDATQGFPSHEQFGLTSQLRRAAVSVPSNIAEGRNHYFES